MLRTPDEAELDYENLLDRDRASRWCCPRCCPRPRNYPDLQVGSIPTGRSPLGSQLCARPGVTSAPTCVGRMRASSVACAPAFAAHRVPRGSCPRAARSRPGRPGTRPRNLSPRRHISTTPLRAGNRNRSGQRSLARLYTMLDLAVVLSLVIVAER